MHKLIHKGLIVVALLTMMTIMSAAQEDNMLPDGNHILAWVAPGDDLGAYDLNSPGQLVFFNPDGSTTPIFDLPTQTTRVVPCGDQATSPDGEHIALFVGETNDIGTLYLMHGTDPELHTISTDLNAMACVGLGTFQYSPDSSRLAYLDYAGDFGSDVSATAFLRIYDAETQERIESFENVAAFNLTDTGANIISFFDDNDGLAVEVAFLVWDGTRDREVATLFADEENDCYYTSASLATLPDDTMAAVMGYRCRNTGTQWQLYRIDPANRSATQVAFEEMGLAFASFARANVIIPTNSPDTVFFTRPDGFAADTVSLQIYDGANVNQFAAGSIKMPRLAVRPYDISNHAPVFSPDGSWLAMSREQGGEVDLLLVDLDMPNLPPIEIAAGRQGDIISEILFSPDSPRVFFVAGAERPGNNALFEADLTTGTASRFDRGRFAQGVISPDGDAIAIVNWEVIDEGEPEVLTLIVMNTTSGAVATLYEGADVTDGDVTNLSFAYPLAWRR